MEQIMREKLCMLSKMKAERTSYLRRSDFEDANNNGWMASRALNNVHESSQSYTNLTKKLRF